MRKNMLLPIGLGSLLVVTISLMSCRPHTKAVQQEIVAEQATGPAPEECVSPALLRELKIYSRKLDSLNNDNNQDARFHDPGLDFRIICVFFYQRNHQCYMLLYPPLAYTTDEIDGYFLLDDKLVAVYKNNQDTICKEGIVDMSKLMKSKPPVQFNDENSFYAGSILDISAKVFKVKDNGELVFDAYVW